MRSWVARKIRRRRRISKQVLFMASTLLYAITLAEWNLFNTFSCFWLIPSAAVTLAKGSNRMPSSTTSPTFHARTKKKQLQCGTCVIRSVTRIGFHASRRCYRNVKTFITKPREHTKKVKQVEVVFYSSCLDRVEDCSRGQESSLLLMESVFSPPCISFFGFCMDVTLESFSD